MVSVLLWSGKGSKIMDKEKLVNKLVFPGEIFITKEREQFVYLIF